MLHNCFKKILTNLSIPCLLMSSWVAVAMPTASFEAVVIEIPNTTLSAGSTVPAGTPLKLVTLMTAHIVPEPSTVSRLGVTLTFPKTRFGLRTGSAVTYSIDGETIATEVPVQRIIHLETNVGRIAGVGFSIGKNSYVSIPANTPVEGVTSTIADSIARTTPILGIENFTYGFFPANAERLSGQMYLERYRGSEFRSNMLIPVVLYDADGLRGTSGPAGEIILTDRQDNRPISRYTGAAAEEVEVEVVFNDGRKLQVLAIRYVARGGYTARAVLVYFFDTEALIANGRSIEDIAQVISSTPVNHDLHWEQLGFSNVQQNNNLNTSENRPPVANNDSYVVNVSSRLNVETSNGVLANDSDTRGDILTARLTSQTSNGILVFLNDGSFSYTPNLRFTGEDSFTYSAFDGEASSTATVTINVQQSQASLPLEQAKDSQISLSQAKDSLFLIVEQKKLAHDVFITLSEHWQKRHLKLLVRVESLHLRAIKRRLKNHDLNSILGNSTGIFNSSKLQKLYWELVNRGQNSVLDAFHVSAFLKEMDIVNLQSVIDASKNTRITNFSQRLMNNSKKHLRILIKQIERQGGIYEPQEMRQNELNAMPNEGQSTPNEGNVSSNQNDAEPIARSFTNDEILRLNAIVRRSLNVINEFDSIRGSGLINNSISRIRELSEQARNALSDYVIAREEIETGARNNNEIFNLRARSVFAGQLDFVEDINRELSAELNKMS